MILDKFKLDGKKAVVTGGTKGLGKAIALALAQAGADIALVSRGDNPELRDEIKALGRLSWHHVADLSDRAQTRKIIPSLAEQMGGLDVLVNCAGIITRMPNEEFPESAWDANLEVNLHAAMLMNQAAAKLMIEKGHGKIINVASILSFQGGLNVPAYAASKHALVGLTRSCCNAWADKGVNVNAIAPGFFATDFTQALQDDPERSAALMGRVPAKRWGNAEDIGGAAVYLASAASDFVHGATLTVDGGWLAN
ncbi:MAG: SDR family oxidoreductase [Desulfobacterales bacterium]|jgi:2-deoxy-D-gluconate 3-dehydrogenase